MRCPARVPTYFCGPWSSVLRSRPTAGGPRHSASARRIRVAIKNTGGSKATAFIEQVFFVTNVDEIAALARVASATVYAVSGGKQILLHTVGGPYRKALVRMGRRLADLGALHEGLKHAVD